MVMLACNTSQTETAKTDSVAPVAPETAATPPAPEAPVAPVAPKEYKTKTGKIFLVEETHPTGMSLSTVKVGFAGDSASYTLSDIDPISNSFLADLNTDGFEELYLVSTAAGSGSYGKIYGYASLRDKSIGMVNLPDLTENDMAKGGKFEGYEGHDEYEVAGSNLLRKFPVKGDKPGTRVVTYKLVPGEAMLQLKPVASKLQ
jgi:hypothetical protein